MCPGKTAQFERYRTFVALAELYVGKAFEALRFDPVETVVASAVPSGFLPSFPPR
jgi:hypothetical protein